MDSGTALVVVVCMLGLIALVLVGSAKPDGQRANGAAKPVKSIPKAADAQVGQSMRHVRTEEEDALLAGQSALVIPPPDEARIQAVAPKNDLQIRR